MSLAIISPTMVRTHNAAHVLVDPPKQHPKCPLCAHYGLLLLDHDAYTGRYLSYNAPQSAHVEDW